ncbi:MAG: formate/nitrite transporter family protein [Bacillota bacterium]
MYDIHIDAYSPKEMAKRVETIGVAKATNSFTKLFILSWLAGAFIALGAQFYAFIVHDSTLFLGLTQLLGGLGFTLGLILVIVGGAELFTGNTLIVMAYVQNKITLFQMLRNWLIVFIGNFGGALAVVLFVFLSQQPHINNELVGTKTILIANTKVNYSFLEAFIRGILCNILVALAVWLSFGARGVADKIIAILLPITAFVASGFEHSIANMYFVPMGILLLNKNIGLPQAELIIGSSITNESLNWTSFLLNNLIPVTIGNVVGGVFFVGLIYWFVYLNETDPGLY